MTSEFHERPVPVSSGMQWQAVESSQIEAIGYESGAEYPLGIKFPAGKRTQASEYHYKNVTPELHAEFLAAESIGSFFGKNIKSRPDLFPFKKVEADPTEPPSSPNGGGADSPKIFTTTTSRSTHTTDAEGVVEPPPPGSALALIDSMADDLLFTPGAITDAQLAAGRQWYLIEAKKYDITTDKARTELKRFARPLQKLRTGIEARAKELTGATKRKIAAIDAEKRRLVQIVGGIEDDVLRPLTEWEQEDESRKANLSGIVARLAGFAQTYHPDIPTLTAEIAELESFDLSGMQEYKVGAESAIAASLKVLKPELERRKVSEANEAELARLRAESAARAEADRLYAVAKQAREQAERESKAAVEYAEQKRLAAEQETKRQAELAEQRAIETAAQAKRDQEQAIENERMRVAVEAKREREADEARAADKEHRTKVNYEAASALVSECQIDEPAAYVIIEAIAKGIISHVKIEY